MLWLSVFIKNMFELSLSKSESLRSITNYMYSCKNLRTQKLLHINLNLVYVAVILRRNFSKNRFLLTFHFFFKVYIR